MRVGLLVLLAACGAADNPYCVTPKPAQERVEKPNILLVVLDDVGLEMVGAYDRGAQGPPTPTLDCIADRGLRFDNAYANPVCSSTRAALVTSIEARNNGVGATLGAMRNLELDPNLPSVAHTLARAGYATGAFGKWHLSSPKSANGAWHPNIMGFDHFAGTLNNAGEHSDDLVGEGPFGFRRWEKTVNGQAELVEGYLTTDTVDDTVDWIAQEGNRPWFALVSFHAAHGPWHRPPAKLHTQRLGLGPSERALYMADLEALDTELGRLLGSMKGSTLANTLVVVVADNGTPRSVYRPMLLERHAKGSVFEQGINVPMIVAGPGVPAGTHTSALAHVVDLGPTLAEWVGLLPPTNVDGVSLSSVLEEPELDGPRSTVRAEFFWPNFSAQPKRHDRAVRSARYKLIHRTNHGTRMHDLQSDPNEMVDLLQAPLDADAEAALVLLTRFL
jgi:arylsulfatase A-like enzyme